MNFVPRKFDLGHRNKNYEYSTSDRGIVGLNKEARYLWSKSKLTRDV
jgi:hypothetical protein